MFTRMAELKREGKSIAYIARIFDVVGVTDPRCGLATAPFRVQHIITEFDRAPARYHQTMTLGAP